MKGIDYDGGKCFLILQRRGLIKEKRALYVLARLMVEVVQIPITVLKLMLDETALITSRILSFLEELPLWAALWLAITVFSVCDAVEATFELIKRVLASCGGHWREMTMFIHGSKMISWKLCYLVLLTLSV